MAKALDCGTANILAAWEEKGEVVFKQERNAFIVMENESFYETLLENNSANYIKRNDQLYVIGEQALHMAPLAKVKARRPMAKGLLNKEESEALAMLKIISTAMVGKPSYEGEMLAITCPANPLDNDQLDNTFHSMMIQSFFTDQGFETKVINEAVSLAYHMRPTIQSEEGEMPVSGISMSFGGGMTNVVVMMRGIPFIQFSIAQGGDTINKQAAEVANISEEKMCIFKEKNLDLSEEMPTDRRLAALSVYYNKLMETVVKTVKQRLAENEDEKIEDPCDIVIGGGTSQAKGFLDKFTKVIEKSGIGVPVKDIRQAEDPIKAIVHGTLVISTLEEKRKQKQKEKEMVEEKKKPDPPKPKTDMKKVVTNDIEDILGE